MQGGSIMSTRASIRPWGASMCGRLSRWCMKAYGGGGRMIRCRTRALGWRSWLAVWGGVVWFWLVLIKDFFATEGHGIKIKEKYFSLTVYAFKSMLFCTNSMMLGVLYDDCSQDNHFDRYPEQLG